VIGFILTRKRPRLLDDCSCMRPACHSRTRLTGPGFLSNPRRRSNQLLQLASPNPGRRLQYHKEQDIVSKRSKVKQKYNVNYLIPKNNRPVWFPDLEALDISPESMTEIPVLGWVAAGQPVDLSEDQEQLSVPTNMVRKNSYAVRVRGHSMIDDNIQDGDVIVVEKRETAANGESVIAMINGETVTLKKFYVEKDGIRLQPANPAMAAIWLRNEEVQILGIVTGVIRPMDAA